MILLEIKAMWREFMKKEYYRYFFFVLFVFIWVMYGISIVFHEQIAKLEHLLCLGLMSIGICGLFNKENLFIRYYRTRAIEILQYPRSVKQVLFLKSIKYELFDLLPVVVLLSILFLPIFLTCTLFTAVSAYFAGIFLFLCTNCWQKLFKIYFKRNTKLTFLQKMIVTFIVNSCLYIFFILKRSKDLFQIQPFLTSLKTQTSNISFLTLALLFLILYIASFMLLIHVAGNCLKIEHHIEQRRNFSIPFQNPMLCKLIRELLENARTYKLGTMLGTQLLSILFLRGVIQLKVLPFQVISFGFSSRFIFFIVLSVITAQFFWSLHDEGDKIHLYIQAGFPLKKYLLLKIGVTSIFNTLYVFALLLTLFVCQFITIETFLENVPTLLIGTVTVTISMQFMSNMWVDYSSQENIEKKLAFLFSTLSVMYYAMFFLLCFFMCELIHVSVVKAILIVIAISVADIALHFVLIHLFQRRFYGNYKKYI